MIRASAVACLCIAARALAGQAPAAATGPASVPPWLAPRTLVVHRVVGAPPTIDGRLDDPAWAQATPATDFSTIQPNPGVLASRRTEVRVLYDDEAVYVAFRCFEPHPEQIVAPYPRRDNETTSEWVFAEFDTRGDRRTAFSFGLNPRAVQVDGMFTADTLFSSAWDAVWDGAARIDSAGWTAEFRIPFSQVPLAKAVDGHLVWYASFYRQSVPGGEASDWSPRLPTYAGVVSHFNTLVFDGAPRSPEHLEVVPYASERSTAAPRSTGDPFTPAGVSRPTGGADFRVGLSSALTLNGAVHPDFGQVEADPSTLNLTTFETFLPEQRPLFVHGADAFTFDLSAPFASRGNSFALESPFYSRRVGRPPQGTAPDSARFIDQPELTPLLGAAQLTGQTANGWAIGALDAWTGAVTEQYADSMAAIHTIAVEPLTHFAVVRASHQSAHGDDAIGAIATAVNRFTTDSGLSNLLPADAWVFGLDGRHRFAGDRYELRGAAALSDVSGDANAIRTITTGPGHYFQRPDAGYLSYDSLATRLAGGALHVTLAQVGGNWRWSIGGHAMSPGFDINDAGFQRNADWLLATGQLVYFHTTPSAALQDWWFGTDAMGIGWDFAGERRAAEVGLHGGVDFSNRWSTWATVDQDFTSLSLESLRGGPGLLLPPRTSWSNGGNSDWRRRVQLMWTAGGYWEPSSGSRDLNFAPSVLARVSDRLTLTTGPAIDAGVSGWQFVAQTKVGAASHYVVGRARQSAFGWTLRADYGFSSHLTLQAYAQPFVAAASYDRFKEVVQPRAASPAARFSAISTTFDSSTNQFQTSTYSFTNPAFNEGELNATVVLRWEFRAGSTLYLVWTDQQSGTSPDGSFRLGPDLGRLFHEAGTSVLLAKVTYWLAP